MLLLTRKIGESIIINDSIEINIVEIGNGVVKIGVEAPKNIKVFRKELITLITKENIESSKNIDEIIKKINK